MAEVPQGVYVAECDAIVESTGAQGVAVFVFNGRNGSGLTVRADDEFVRLLPGLLRMAAEGVEAGLVAMDEDTTDHKGLH